MKTNHSQYYGRIKGFGLPASEVLNKLKDFFYNNRNQISTEFNYEEKGWRKIDFPGAIYYNTLDDEKMNRIKNYNGEKKFGSKWSENERQILCDYIKSTNDIKILSKVTGRNENSIMRMAQRVLYENPELLCEFNGRQK